MGHAVASVGELGDGLARAPAAALLVGIVALVAQLFSFVLGWIPLFGLLLSPVVTGLGIGSAFVVANGASTPDGVETPAVDEVLEDHWLSLLGVPLLQGLLYVCVVLVVLSLNLALAVGVAEVASVLPERLSAVTALLFPLVLFVPLFVYALFAQFLFPAVAVGRHTATDSLGVAGGIVRDRPLSALGFTVVRLLLRFGPPALFFAASVLVLTGSDPVRTVLSSGLSLSAWAVVAAGDLGWDDAPALLAAGGLGVLVGETLRIGYTTVYYRRVTGGA